MWREITSVYRASKKKKDINLWTEWVCRPPAAVIVYALKNTRITPNQLTFASLALAALAGAMLVLWPGYAGLVAAIIVFEISFVLDCADGQLARARGQASRLGHLLDFLMDEIKAFLIFGCVAIRLWITTGDPLYLAVGIVGMFALASGTSLTSFTRRPEYGAPPPTEDGQPAHIPQRAGPIGAAITAAERVARVLVHYPSYIWLAALLDRIELYFWAYAAVNALYLARMLLAIASKLGRFDPPPGADDSRDRSP
jgi:phosphatidylglycerophosphate synthase